MIPNLARATYNIMSVGNSRIPSTVKEILELGANAPVISSSTAKAKIV
jgi:putative N-acetylmannosamine-6-phosphate epimerase